MHNSHIRIIYMCIVCCKYLPNNEWNMQMPPFSQECLWNTRKACVSTNLLSHTMFSLLHTVQIFPPQVLTSACLHTYVYGRFLFMITYTISGYFLLIFRGLKSLRLYIHFLSTWLFFFVFVVFFLFVYVSAISDAKLKWYFILRAQKRRFTFPLKFSYSWKHLGSTSSF